MSQSLQWAKGYNSSSSSTSFSSYSESIDIDSLDNVYTIGNFTGVIDLDPGPLTQTVLAKSVDCFLTKLDKNGNLIWGKSFGGKGSDEGRSVVIGKDGYLYIGGLFRDTADFDLGVGTFNLFSSTAGTGGFLAKYDLNCNLMWARSIRGVPFSLMNDANSYLLSVDDDGNVYSSGYFSGSVDFDSGPGTYTLYANPGDQNYIAKYNSSGNIIFAKQFAGYASIPYSLTIRTNGDINLTGMYYPGTYDYDPGPGVASLINSSGGGMFLLKLDSMGIFKSLKQFDNARPGFHDKSSKIDSIGNIYLTGYFNNTVDFDPNAGTYTLSTSSSLNEDAFICKIDTSGNLVFVKRFGSLTASGVRGYGIAIDAKRNIYSIGKFSGPVDFDPGPTTYTLNFVNFSTNGAMFISKLDSIGNFVWAKAVEGFNSSCEGRSIQVEDSNIYMAGTFNYVNDFDPGPSVYTLTSTTTGNIYSGFTMKLGPCSLPSISSISSNSSICVGQTASITVNGTLNSANYWQLSNVGCGVSPFTINPSGTFAVSPTANSTYYILGYQLCSSQQVCDSVNIIVNLCTGIEEFNSTNFQIYPNPANDYITIKNYINEKSYLSIYNSLGAICYNTILNEPFTIINVSTLRSGVYFIKIDTNKGTVNQKLVKE